MSVRFGASSVSLLLFALVLALLPGSTAGQEGWPPLEIETTLQQQDDGDLFRYNVLLRNVSDIDLIDVIVASTLPEGATFNRFGMVEYATTSFDGQHVSFTVLKVPARKTVGPVSAYVALGDLDPEAVRTSIYAEWSGQMPGSLFVPDWALGGGLVALGTPEPTEVGVDVAQPEETEEVKDEHEAVGTPSAETGSSSLWDILEELESHEFVDLTHTFGPGIPNWPGFPDAEFKTLYDYDADGFFAQEFVHVGQYGTHMDAPSHFHKDLRTLDQIGLKEMMAPLVVINVADKVAANPDYDLTIEDVVEWESRNGPIPDGAFVAMRSDWSQRWPSIEAYENRDESGQAHCPGWTVEALEYLYEERQIVGNGHETLDTDSAVAQAITGFAAERYALGTDHYQVGLMANLDKVPETGAIVFVTVPKPKNGSGFPARVFAIVP